jgi:hypothetical protein
MLRPILEEKELIGQRLKASEIAKICRNNRTRLPIHMRTGRQLANELIRLGGESDMFTFDDLEIAVYMETDHETGRYSPEIEIKLAVSLEEQYLKGLQEKAEKEGVI